MDAIFGWLRERSKDQHHPINPHYWIQVRRLWKKGTDDEFEMGKKESEAKETFDERAKYTLGKLRDKEYAHGI